MGVFNFLAVNFARIPYELMKFGRLSPFHSPIQIQFINECQRSDNGIAANYASVENTSLFCVLNWKN